MGLIANQFNESLVNNVDGLPSDEGGLLFAININQRKFLTAVSASLEPASGAYTGTDNVMGRLLICTGYLSYTNSQFYGPYPKQTVYPAGAGRIIYDTQFFNNINLQFSEPIICSADEILNVCIGIGWVQGEAGAGITPCIGRLSVIGNTGNFYENNTQLPFSLR